MTVSKFQKRPSNSDGGAAVRRHCTCSQTWITASGRRGGGVRMNRTLLSSLLVQLLLLAVFVLTCCPVTTVSSQSTGTCSAVGAAASAAFGVDISCSSSDTAAAATTTTKRISTTTTTARVHREEKFAVSTPTDNNKTKRATAVQWKSGTLRPRDIPERTLFRDFHTRGIMNFSSSNNNNTSNNVIEDSREYWDGSLMEQQQKQQNVTLVKQALPRETAHEIVQILRQHDAVFMKDPDSVDGMPTFEFYLSDGESQMERKNMEDSDVTTKGADDSPRAKQERARVRQQLLQLTQPYVDNILTPFVRAKFPDVCNNHKSGNRNCTPCYSLIRRYRSGERQSHARHRDGHALVTVVTSLSDYGTDYLGGLYITSGAQHLGEKLFLELNAGDAAIHQPYLLHGVKVDDLPSDKKNNQNKKKPVTERWSWILWYKDSDTCEDHSGEWFADCAEDGDAVCQVLHATKIGNLPNLSSKQEEADLIIDWNLRSADSGNGQAAIKVARAYMKQLPSRLPFDVEKARAYYQIAIDSNEPNGHYGLAQLLVAESNTVKIAAGAPAAKKKQLEREVLKKQHAFLVQAIRHLESAALLSHAYSMFNLGIAHIYGYGTPNQKVDMALGVEWLLLSGLPEGYITAAHYAASIGDKVLEAEYTELAATLGYFQPWRKMARQRTGSGGAGGVDLNLKWPESVARGGMKPPEY